MIAAAAIDKRATSPPMGATTTRGWLRLLDTLISSSETRRIPAPPTLVLLDRDPARAGHRSVIRSTQMLELLVDERVHLLLRHDKEAIRPIRRNEREHTIKVLPDCLALGSDEHRIGNGRCVSHQTTRCPHACVQHSRAAIGHDRGECCPCMFRERVQESHRGGTDWPTCASTRPSVEDRDAMLGSVGVGVEARHAPLRTTMIACIGY